MNHMRGWGLLLAIGVPLLILLGWSRLGKETSRVQIDRYAEWSAVHVTADVLTPLNQHFRKHRTVAGPADFTLPPVPKKSGIKAWSVRPDGVLRVELDAKEDGQPVTLNYVPVLKSAQGVSYDCVSAAPLRLIDRICHPEWLRSVDDIPAQLQANATFLQNLPPMLSPAGTTLRPGAVGSVYVVPVKAEDRDRCGYQCVQRQSCITPRPLACARVIVEGNTSRQEIVSTRDDFRGSAFAMRQDADRVCEQQQGAGSHVLGAGYIERGARLQGGNEYWVNDDMQPENNCWDGARR